MYDENIKAMVLVFPIELFFGGDGVITEDLQHNYCEGFYIKVDNSLLLPLMASF